MAREIRPARRRVWRAVAITGTLATAVLCGGLAGAWIAITAPPDPGAGPVVASTSQATASPRQAWPTLEQPLNVLVLGIDYNGTGRNLSTDGERTRTDTMVLVRIDPGQKQISALSIPRDTRAELPGYGIDKINAANVYGGLPMVKATVTRLLGVPVDRVVRLNVNGAEQVMAEIGGLDLDIERNFNYDDNAGRLHIHLKPGMQHLDAKQAVAYARFRHDNQGDLGRVARQQRFLHAVADKLFQPANLLHLPALVTIARQHVETDLTSWELTRLVGTAPGLWHQDVRWGTVPGTYIYWHDISYWEPDLKQTAMLVTRLFGRGPLATETTSSVLVLDARHDPGTTTEVTAALKAAGFTLVGVRRVAASDYPTTTLIDRRHDAQPDRWQSLQGLIHPEQSRIGDPGIDEPLSGDYVVVLGPHFHAVPSTTASGPPAPPAAGRR